MATGSDPLIYLSTLPSSTRARRAALWTLGGFLLLFTVAVPFARIKFPPVPAFIASYQSSLAVVYVITSILLYSQFVVLRSRGILYLANGYLFTAIVIAGYAVTYDDLFVSEQIFFAGPETTIWFYLMWHAGLPAFGLAYALVGSETHGASTRRASIKIIWLSVLGVGLAAAFISITLTRGHVLLPKLMLDGKFQPTLIIILATIYVLCVSSILILIKKRSLHTALDIWMIVILCAWTFDISLSAVLNEARFDFGYYAGRLYGVFAAALILAILLAETASLQLRLSVIMRRQVRRAADEVQLYAQRERLFSAAVRSSNDAIIIKSFNGTITGWNRAAEQLFGYPASEALGQPIAIIVPDDRRDEVTDILEKISQGIAIENRETVRRTKDGRLLDISLSVSPVLSASGKAIGAAKVARDITEQKLNEEKFKLAVDASPSGVVMFDAAGLIMLVNPEMERLFGYTRDELLGQPVDILIPQDKRNASFDLRHAYASRPVDRAMQVRIELSAERKNGETFPIEIGLNRISTRSGMLVLAVIVDVTDRKKAEKALHESERMARGILDTALDGYLQFSGEHTIVTANQQAERILGWSREEMTGHPVSDILDNTRPDALSWDELLGALDSNDDAMPGTRVEMTVRTKAGAEIPLELSLTRYATDQGCLYNAFIRDLTEQHASEAQLRQVQKMEAIGQLTGGVAHDFNNILTVITGTIEILAQGVADRPQLVAITKLIDTAATRGGDLTRHLLAFSRKQPLRPTIVDVNALIFETAKLLRPTLGAQLQIDLNIKPNIWPALVDRSQLTTAILNLALNARDATPAGGTLTIRTDNTHLDAPLDTMENDTAPGDYILIEVRDTGTGMDRETLARVFEPFFTTKAVGKGTGLGLSMVYGFMKQSKGHITVSSVKDVGTSITLYLPRAYSPALIEQPATSAGQLQGGNEIILIVEDDPLVRAYVKTQIEGLGYRSLTAKDGDEAELIIDSGRPIDLLFTDIVLPGLRNGRQIADEAMKKRPGLKVLFTSGYPQDAFNDELALRDVLLLTKPYRAGDLSEMIRKALSA
jgi:PAS domain S-box-containing protein